MNECPHRPSSRGFFFGVSYRYDDQEIQLPEWKALENEDHDTHPIMMTAERLVSAYADMTGKEKSDLLAWEASNVTGDGRVATTDWPGWANVFRRIFH